MQVRADHAVSVGLIRWPHRPSHCTIVVKLAFGAGGEGDAALLPDAVSVTVDRYDAGGILSAPCDFAPFKPRCDVVLVGAATSMAGAARLTVRTDGAQATERLVLDKTAKQARLLAAHPTLGALSDPTDPAAEEVWRQPAFEFARFQCAPFDQRVDFPREWLAFNTEIGGSTFKLSIPLGARVLSLQGSAQRELAVQADTFLIDPAARRCSVIYRGMIDFSEVPAKASTLIVSTQPSLLQALLRGTESTFRAGAAIEPGLLRRLLAISPEPSDMPRITRGPSRTVRMSARTQKLGRPAPPPPAQETIMLSTQDLLIVELPDEQLSAVLAPNDPPPLPPLSVQDTVTLARSDLAALDLPEESFDSEVTVDDAAATHALDRIANAPSVTEDLFGDSWSDSTLDRTPPLPARPERPADFEPVLSRYDTLTITGDAGVVAAALPFRSGPEELEAMHTLTISGDEANSMALPFVRPKTVPPPEPQAKPASQRPKTVPPPEPQTKAPSPLMRLALRPPPAAQNVVVPAVALADTADEPPPPPVPIAHHAAAPVASPPAAATTMAAVVPRSPKGGALSLEQVMTIKRELFGAPDQRRAILASHGLTGLQWRLAERSLARDLDDKTMNADRVRKLLGQP